MQTPRQPGDNQPLSAPPPIATATGAEAATKLVVGACYAGIIESLNTDGTYNVQIGEPRSQVQQVRAISPVIGGLLGFNVRTKLSVGSKVQMTYGKVSYIVGVASQPEFNDALTASTRSMLWGEAVNQAATVDPLPEDLMEGEFEIANLYGVMLQFLTHMLRMSAGDRAAVEVHLLNDMVRLVSSQFQHISGIGEELIFDHGRPTLERTWTSYRHELMGKLKEGEEFSPLNGEYFDKEKLLTAENITQMGRYRLLEFIGFAGDFIHSFVSDPPEAIAQILSESQGGAGKSWVHRNSDGTVLVQSVTEIRFERVCRIPVPVRKASHEHPDITKQRHYDQLEKNFLALPDFGSIAKKSAYKLSYHLRSYSRWLSRMHAFARMLQLGSEYAIQSEADAQKPSWNNLEPDKEQVAAQAEYYDAYACICILRDGSIVLHDGYGSTVMLTNGNVQISAARHLELEAGGDVRIVSGGSVFVKARRNIELSATVGGIVVHCYAFLRTLCEKGTIWLRSLATSDSEAPEAKNDGPAPEVLSIAGQKFGVVLEGATAGVATRSSGQILISAEGPLGDDEDSRNSIATDVVITTNGNIRTKATNLLLKATRSLVIDAGEAVALNSSVLYGAIAEIDLLGGLNFQNGKLSVRELSAPTVTANNILGKKLAPWTDPNDPPALPTPRHFNHIQALPDNVVVTLVSGQNMSGLKALSFATGTMSGSSYVPVLSAEQGPVWKFLDRTEYYWDGREDKAGALSETLTQQYLRLDVTDGDLWQGNGYDEWNWGETLTGYTRVEEAAGYGFQASVYQSSTGNNLHAPLSYDPTDPAAFSTELSWEATDTFKFKFLKR